MSFFIQRLATYSGKKIDMSLYENQFLTTEALETGTITFNIPANVTTAYITSISYRKNGGDWVDTNNSSSEINIEVSVVADDIIEWKGIIPRSNRVAGNPGYTAKFVSGGAEFNLYGNLLSLFWGGSFRGKIMFPWKANNASLSVGAYGLFEETNVVDASNFILPILDLTVTASDGHQYGAMFKNCTSLVYPPMELPATIIGSYAYYQMFTGCTSLTTMPNMESIQDTNGRAAYSGMFEGCSALQYNTNQRICINTATYQGCHGMFKDCISMVNAPNIEVYELGTPLSGYGVSQAFCNMFYGCTSLETPPERFDVTAFDNQMFYCTFAHCTSLQYAPVINIRDINFINSTLTPSCGRYSFDEMFYNCTSLIDASGINIQFPDDAEWHGERTFCRVFWNCTSLEHGPTLHIKGTEVTKDTMTLFQLMYNCQNMETHDIELDFEIDSNATVSTGVNASNSNTFYHCTSMVISPRIIRPTLIKEYEYNRAFDGNTAMRHVYCSFDTIYTNAINSWLANCGSGTGKTIHQAGSATLPTGDTSGVPSGWTLDTTDWTSQRHARMRIYLTSPGANATTSLTTDDLDEIYDTLNNTYKFDYYGDSITFDGNTYYVWENLDDPTYKLLTFTDNFYELRLQSYEFGEGYDPYTWTYGVIDSPSTLYYDNEYFEDHGWVYIKCTRLQG